MANQLDAPDQSPGATEQAYKIQFQYGDGNRADGIGHSIVGVQTSEGTKKKVYYRLWDSRHQLDGATHIGPVERDLDDSCVNCGYHRPSWEGIFEKTRKGLTCLQLDRPGHHALRTLPSDDSGDSDDNVAAGCICPHHIEQGTQKWHQKVMETQTAFLDVADMGQGKGEIVYKYPDFSVTYGEGGLPEITPKY